jgi:hypothetical protein
MEFVWCLFIITFSGRDGSAESFAADALSLLFDIIEACDGCFETAGLGVFAAAAGAVAAALPCLARAAMLHYSILTREYETSSTRVCEYQECYDWNASRTRCSGVFACVCVLCNHVT